MHPHNGKVHSPWVWVYATLHQYLVASVREVTLSLPFRRTTLEAILQKVYMFTVWFERVPEVLIVLSEHTVKAQVC